MGVDFNPTLKTNKNMYYCYYIQHDFKIIFKTVSVNT